MKYVVWWEQMAIFDTKDEAYDFYYEMMSAYLFKKEGVEIVKLRDGVETMNYVSYITENAQMGQVTNYEIAEPETE